jgi:uncharacterized protein (DUF2062 family)
MMPELATVNLPTAPSRWRRWFINPVLAQLRQGITPEKVSLTIALGVTLGVFPIMGTTTFLCAAAGLAFRLNQPILQAINYAIYPLQIALILVFVRIGELLYRAPRLPFSFSELMAKFRASPGDFFSDFASTFLHGITAWLLLAPLLAGLLYFALRPILRNAVTRPS